MWDVHTLRSVKRLGVVPDESKKDRAGKPLDRPFYERSLCAAAFSPDGRLLIAIGTDDQHTLGVWLWGQAQLLVSAPALQVHPRRGVKQRTTRRSSNPASLSLRCNRPRPLPLSRLQAHPLGIHQLAVAPQWGGMREDPTTQQKVWSDDEVRAGHASRSSTVPRSPDAELPISPDLPRRA